MDEKTAKLTLNRVVQAKVSEDEERRIQAAALADNRTVSAYVRDRVLKALGKTPKTPII